MPARLDKVTLVAFSSIVIALAVMGPGIWTYLAPRQRGAASPMQLESIVNLRHGGRAAFTRAIQVSRKPADHDHQFGHHKAEYFRGAVLEGC